MEEPPRCCIECGREIPSDLPVYIVEVFEPMRPSLVAQLCSPKCVAAWLSAYRARRDGRLGEVT